MAEWIDTNKPSYNASAADDDLELSAVLAKYGPRSKEILEQMAYAKKLRDTGMPTGRNPTGRIFTAAHPLEFASAAYDKARGQQGVKEGFGAQNEYTKSLVEELQKIVGERRTRRATGDVLTQSRRNTALPTDYSDYGYKNDDEVIPPI